MNLSLYLWYTKGRLKIAPLIPHRQSPICYSSGSYSNTSPGWQSSALQMADRVENRIADTFPVLIFDKFTFETPTFSLSSLRLIFRSAMTRSSRNIIPITTASLPTMSHRIPSAALHHIGKYRTAQG